MDSYVWEGDRGDSVPCEGFRTELLDAVGKGCKHLGLEAAPHRRGAHSTHHPAKVPL